MSVAELNWDEPRFSSKEAIAAIGCTTSWLNNLTSGRDVRYRVRGEEVVDERHNRRRFVFKFRTVFHLALIHKLQHFLHITDAISAATPAAACDPLFALDLAPDQGAVYLVVGVVGDFPGDRLYSPTVVPAAFLMEVLGVYPGRQQFPRVVFNVTPVFDQVVKGLGL